MLAFHYLANYCISMFVTATASVMANIILRRLDLMKFKRVRKYLTKVLTRAIISQMETYTDTELSEIAATARKIAARADRARALQASESGGNV